MPLTIYGSSDDLIEIEGDIREEFTAEDGYEARVDDLLAFSDGTVLRIKYTDAGIWRITPVMRGASGLTIEQTPENDEDNYSDRATLSGERVVWVVHGIAFAKTKE